MAEETKIKVVDYENITDAAVNFLVEPGKTENQIENLAIADRAITPEKTAISQLSQIAADIGTITAGNITINSSGFIRGGQSAYNIGIGFYLGYAGGKYVFSLGDPAGNYFCFDGTNFTSNGAVSVSSLNIPDTTTANSFHVDNQGNAWWGTNLATGLTTAPAYVKNTGEAKFSNVIVSGAFNTSVLTYGQKMATAGTLMVAKSGGKLRSAVTTLTSPSTFDVDIEDPASGHLQLFSVGDILILQNATLINYVTVSSVSDQTTFFRYTCTKSNGTNSTFSAGSAATDLGASGQGYLEMSADGTNAPWYSVKTHAGSPWTTTTEIIRLGNLNGIGGIAADYYGIFIGDYASGKYLRYDSNSGDLVVNDSILSNNNMFGDGSDGDVTISSNTSLTSDMFYNNLTVNDGVTLNPNGYRIFVKVTLNLNSTGKIARNGNNGGAGGAGGNGSASAYGGTVGAAGTAGAASAALADGSIKGAVAGVAGVVGGVGAKSASSSPTDASGGASGTTGTSVVKSIGSNGVNGGAGGAGGSVSGTLTASRSAAGGGGGGAGGTLSGTIFNIIRNGFSAYLLYDFLPAADNLRSSSGSGGAAGGGGGGAGWKTSAGFESGVGGSGGGSGGAGGSGGIVSVFARKIIGTGTIEANGGTGGNGGAGGAGSTYDGGGAGGAAAAGGGGGGAGGAGGTGGVVIVVYSYKTAVTIQALGGTKGTSGAGGSPSTKGSNVSASAGATPTGVDGNAGKTILLQV